MLVAYRYGDALIEAVIANLVARQYLCVQTCVDPVVRGVVPRAQHALVQEHERRLHLDADRLALLELPYLFV